MTSLIGVLFKAGNRWGCHDGRVHCVFSRPEIQRHSFQTYFFPSTFDLKCYLLRVNNGVMCWNAFLYSWLLCCCCFFLLLFFCCCCFGLFFFVVVGVFCVVFLCVFFGLGGFVFFFVFFFGGGWGGGLLDKQDIEVSNSQSSPISVYRS